MRCSPRSLATEAAGSAIAAFAIAQIVLSCAVKIGAIDSGDAEKMLQMAIDGSNSSDPAMQKAKALLQNVLGLPQSGQTSKKQ